MADLFISYSRKDREFVQRLNQALVARGRDVWVDLDDILPTEEWMKKICSGIEGANNFVFVISPDAIASKVCGQEVDHAVDNHKRIVPILHRDVAAGDAPPALAKINWIPFGAAGDFEQGVAVLLKAIDLDPEWVNAHTRLQVRALEWERRNHDDSVLLRGRDLRDAEQWLVRDAKAEPKPTPLQTQFLIASRRAETRRLRLSRSAIAVGLVVAIVLALVAFRQYRIASDRLQIATSRELATHAFNHLDDRLDLSMLLGIESTRPSDTYEARNSLLAALQHAPQVTGFLHGHRGTVTTMAFSPDGKTLASGGADTTVRLWDVGVRREIGEPLAVHRSDMADEDDEIRTLAFSPDGGMLAFGSMAGVLGVIQTDTRNLLGETIEFGGTVQTLAFAPDGKALAVSSINFSLFDIATQQRLGDPILGLGATWHPTFDDQEPYSVVVSPDGRTLIFNRREVIWQWDIANRRPLGDPLTGSSAWITRLALAPDGKILASGDQDGGVRLWNLETGEQIAGPLSANAGTVYDLAFSADGAALVWGGSNGTVVRWDVAGQRLDGEPISVGAISTLAISPDGKLLALGDKQGTIRLWQMPERNALGTRLQTTAISGLAVSPDGDTVAVGGEHLALWSASGREQRIDLRDNGVLSVAFDGTGTLLASSGKEGTVRLWDVATGEQLGSPIQARKETDYVWRVALTPDGATVAAVSDGSIGLWDVKTHELIGRLPTGEAKEVYAIALSPDGRTLATGGEDRLVRLWDLATRRAIGQPLDGHAAVVWSLAFSSDGKTLASGDDDGGLRLWDVAHTRALGPPLAGPSTRIAGLAFSPDGTMLAAAGFWRELLLFDLQTRQPLGDPLLERSEYDVVRSVAFNPAGTLMVAGEQDGTLSFLDMGEKAWSSRACAIANRNLSRDEWCRYLHDGGPPHASCADLPALESGVQCGSDPER